MEVVGVIPLTDVSIKLAFVNIFIDVQDFFTFYQDSSNELYMYSMRKNR